MSDHSKDQITETKTYGGLQNTVYLKLLELMSRFILCKKICYDLNMQHKDKKPICSKKHLRTMYGHFTPQSVQVGHPETQGESNPSGWAELIYILFNYFHFIFLIIPGSTINLVHPGFS